VSLLRLSLLAGLAFVIALLLPATGHGDFFISNFNSTLIFTDHPNFYRALADEPSAVFPTGLSGGPYGPLFYYPTAFWLRLLDLLHLVNIEAWQGTDDPALQSPGALLALKLPYLAVYALVAVVLAKMFRDADGSHAAWLWLANPAVIVFTLMMGQNDGWTALASVSALYFGLRAVDGRPLRVGGRELPSAALAMFCLAVGAAIKLSPILLVPAFAWLLGERYRSKLLLAAVAVGAFLLMIAPFLGTHYFWEHGLLGRQAGKATGLPAWSVVLLYAGYLGLVWTSSRNSSDRRWVLIFCFVAFHAFFFIAGGWSPQRAVLFIAALAIAAQIEPWLLVPYLLTTAFSLLLALEHRNEIAVGLFEPLTTRALLIPPLFDSKPEALHAMLLSLTALTWMFGLALLWFRRKASPFPRFLAPLPVVLALSLAGYLALSTVFLHRGVDATPYPEPAPAQQLAAGDRFAFAFISPQDDLRSISFRVESGSGQAAIDITNGAGRALSTQRRAAIHTGRNTFDVPRVNDAKGQWFTVRITPQGSLRLRMTRVPTSLALATADLNGRPLAGTAQFSAHYETTWSTLLGDARSQLLDHWVAMLVSLACCALALAAAIPVMELREPKAPSPPAPLPR
jgi:hypothetical protein